MPAGRMVRVPRTKARTISKLKSDIKKIKKQVRKNTDVVTLDTSNWDTAVNYPAPFGKAVDDNTFTYIKNTTSQQLVPCRCFPLNKCSGLQEGLTDKNYYQREGTKLYLKALNLHYTITTGYDDQALGESELVVVRYMVVWIPGNQRLKSSHTTTESGQIVANELLEYPGNIMSPYRQNNDFKYKILKQGMFSLAWNTNSAGQPIKTGRIKLNLSKRKNKESQYSDDNANPVPLEGRLYFIVFADNVGPTPQDSVPAKIHFVSRLICNE